MSNTNYTNLNKKTRIAHWNANGLKNNLREVADFLERQNIDIFLVNETKLNEKTKCNIPGYQCLRKDRPGNTAGGGVAIFCKNNIEYTEIQTNTTSIESLAVKLKNNIIITSIYARPQTKIDKTDLNLIFNKANSVIAIGDYNAKHINWHCSYNNQNGKVIFKYTSKSNIAVKAPDEYTLYPYKQAIPSVVDFALIKNIVNSEIQTVNELDSDHLPIILTLNDKTEKNEPKKLLNYKKADWDKFTNYLNDNINIDDNLTEKEHIDENVKNLTDNIQKAIQISIPTHNTKSNALTLPKDITRLIKHRNKTRRQFQQHGKDVHRILKNFLTNEIKNRIKKLENESWEAKLKSLSIQDNSIWKMAKVFTKPTMNTIPTLHGTQGLAITNKQKANALAENFEKVHHLTELMGSRQIRRVVNATFNNTKEQNINNDDIQQTTANEIKNAIKKTRPKKAPGPDGIQNIVLKQLPHKVLVQISNIFNASLRLSYYPSVWKHANVLAFQKPGKDKLFPQNYRPISLLPTLSKIFENIILNRLKKHESVNKQLIPQQFGFRQKHSTVQQLVRLTNHISTNFNINKSTAVALLDIEKAFDTVWHKGLIHKLNTLNIPIYLIKIIQNYLTNRTFAVIANRAQSDKQSIVAGVPQGSILGPVLFLYYINDIPTTQKTQVALFADDTAIYSSSWSKKVAIKNVQEHFNVILEHFYNWKIKINEAKTELVIFSKKTKKVDIPPLSVNNEIINPKRSAKYLGVILDDKLNFSQHVQSIHSKAQKIKGMLHHLICKKSALSVKNKLLLYKTLIKPVILYASPIWGYTCKTNINKLQIIQNKILRQITRSERYVKNNTIRTITNSKEIIEEIKNNTKKFFCEQIHHLEILNDVGKINRNNAPYKIKHKLPHHLVMN